MQSTDKIVNTEKVNGKIIIKKEREEIYTVEELINQKSSLHYELLNYKRQIEAIKTNYKLTQEKIKNIEELISQEFAETLDIEE